VIPKSGYRFPEKITPDNKPKRNNGSMEGHFGGTFRFSAGRGASLKIRWNYAAILAIADMPAQASRRNLAPTWRQLGGIAVRQRSCF